jgi:hypothetical protein
VVRGNALVVIVMVSARAGKDSFSMTLASDWQSSCRCEASAELELWRGRLTGNIADTNRGSSHCESIEQSAN